MVEFKLKFDAEDIADAVNDKMDEVVDFIFTNSQQIIVEKGIVDEGSLLKSGNINRNFLDKEIVYTMPYADSIEFGRNPGSMPPVVAINGWVQRKLGIKDDIISRRIAWAIAQDIKKNGTQPRPYLQPAIEAARMKFK